jgi:SAM-dependent methyltransferase
MGDLIELEMGIPRNDPRWEMALEWGQAPERILSPPAGQEPDGFAEHFEQCRCPFWQWFRSLRLDGPMRRMLDVGVGPGHVAHHFALAEFEVVSVTTDEAARRDREQRGMTALHGDMHRLAHRGGLFDLIVAVHALQSSRSPLFALWEWKRLLRPDGYLLVMAHLPLNRPAPTSPSSPAGSGADVSEHFAYGVAGNIMTLTYWQLRWLFKQTDFQLIAETLEDPVRGCLESTEHVDGRRPADPTKPWDVLFLLRKPGRLPHDGALEKLRPICR